MTANGAPSRPRGDVLDAVLQDAMSTYSPGRRMGSRVRVGAGSMPTACTAQEPPNPKRPWWRFW
jgi:hypothetical protein